MFILVLLEDIVRVPPEEFADEAVAIHNQLNQKFANKVIENVGLCIEVHDVSHVSQGTVYAGDGAAFATVKFRMIVFKPFVGELLNGSIKSMDKNGIVVTLDFFDQVIVPPSLMQSPAEWSGSRWYWEFNEHKLWMNVKDQIRVRIEKVSFNPPESKRLALDEKKALIKAQAEAEAKAAEEKNPEDMVKDVKERTGLDLTDLEDLPPIPTRPDDPAVIFKGRPMYITASTNESGLGLTSWWIGSQGTYEGEEGEYEATEEGIEGEEAQGEESAAIEGQEMEVDEEEGLIEGEAAELETTAEE